MKKCGKCKAIKEGSLFNKNRCQKDGLDNTCRECVKLITKRNRDANKIIRLALNPPPPTGVKKCSICGKTKLKEYFYSNRAKKEGVYSSCKDCFVPKLKYPKVCDLRIRYNEQEFLTEAWADVYIKEVLYPYRVSDLGRIMSVKNNLICKPSFDQRGHPQVVLYGEKRTSRRIHRIVAETYIPNLLNKREVNHKDSNKLNPRKSNLEWNTSIENTNHAFEIGLR